MPSVLKAILKGPQQRITFIRNALPDMDKRISQGEDTPATMVMRNQPDRNVNPWCHPFIVFDKDFTGGNEEKLPAEGKARSGKKSDNDNKFDVGKKTYDAFF